MQNLRCFPCPFSAKALESRQNTKTKRQNWFASNFDQIEFSRNGYAPDNSISILKKDVEAALDAKPQEADTRLPDLLVDMLGRMGPKQP